jgi:radical SAM protein with 4Fe4S-binding SPASM domain
MSTTQANGSYGVINTVWKLQFYQQRLKDLCCGNANNIAPVTVHFAPTLRCNHKCYFCTYGKAKKHDSNLEMPLDSAMDYIKKLKDAGVEGLIFTGGGDPCMHKDLLAMMQACVDVGLHFSLNTNGLALNGELSKQILLLKPAYVRLSINAGTPEVQKLMTGVDDFEIVLHNLEALMRNYVLTQSETPLSVAYVVGVTNYFDLENLYQRIENIEKEVFDSTSVHVPIDLTIRPIYNYEGSKIIQPEVYEEIVSFLKKRSTKEAEDFIEFVKQGKQTDAGFLKTAVDTIQNKLWAKTNQGAYAEESATHRIRVYFPAEKFETVGVVAQKPYAKCLGLYFYAFIWPDGRVFPCVEYAGTPGFEIGNLSDYTAKDLFFSCARQEKIDWYNDEVVHARCAAICAYHETNRYLDDICSCHVSPMPIIARFI